MMPVVAYDAAAQEPGSCSRTRADAYLDAGNVRARILNNGALFYQGEPHSYEVPQGSGAHAIYAVAVGIVGIMENTYRAAATRYGEWEFWAGPLDDDGNPPADCAPYDRLWEITRADLNTYNETGIPTTNLLDWPRHLGAPVLDGDGIEGNYDLDGGDRPAIIGDQMIWWVMNDVAGEHKSTDSQPIGLEVHGSAFAFKRPGSYINDVTFYRYTFINKNRVPFEDAYISLYVDVDLGNFADDYVGSDSLLHLGFVYNQDNFDNGGWGYGANPPAAGLTFLRTADDPDGRDNDHDGQIDEPGEQQGMTAFPCTHKEERSWPIDARDYHNCMRGRWPDGQPIIAWGNGIPHPDLPTDEITAYIFSGDPVTGQGWSEINPAVDGSHPPVDPGDRRFYMASGPFTLEPGDEQEIVFAVVWARGADHLDSVRELKKAVARLRDVAPDILLPFVTREVAEPLPALPPVLSFAQNYPNPFRETTTIRYSLPRPMRVRLRVYDVLGREVAVLVDQRQDSGVYSVDFDARGMASGVYVARFEIDAFRFTKTMLVIP